MTTHIDSEAFSAYDRSPMTPCSAPTSVDFTEEPNTLIWCNINGEMRLYSYNGVNVQYQTMSLSTKIDSLSGGVSSLLLTDGTLIATMADGTHTAVQTSSSGSGAGVELTVTVVSDTIVSIDSIDNAGSDYVVGDFILLDIGGVVTVDGVS